MGKMSDDDIFKISKRLAESGSVRTAGKIEFVKDQGPVRRNIRVQGFKFEPDRLRELSKILWACERAHSYAIASLRLFSRMPAADFSPDGLMGGVGYIASVKDMRGSLGQSVEILSSFCDTLHDEVNANHWSQASSDPDVQSMAQDTHDVKSNPDGFVQDQYNEDVRGDEPMLSNPNPDLMNPAVEDPPEKEEDEDDGWANLYTPIASQPLRERGPVLMEKSDSLPKDETFQKDGVSSVGMVMNTTGEASYAAAIRRIPSQIDQRRDHTASSSIPVETMSGPRVNHIGPGEGDDSGHFNGPEGFPSDDPTGEGFNSYDRILEGEDALADGTSGYDFPTQGDESIFKASCVAAGYSWLPGSRNEKLYNYYEPGLSDADINWMRANDAPDAPGQQSGIKYVTNRDPMFEVTK